MADAYIGKNVIVSTELGKYAGNLLSFDENMGKLVLKDGASTFKTIDLLDITEVELQGEQLEDYGAYGRALPEEQMYRLFYDAFNLYGPFEGEFCSVIATGISKFIRDPETYKIKIIIGSDDIFGRIGLCLARLILHKIEKLTVVLDCDIHNLKTLKFQNAFLNSGGALTRSNSIADYTLILYAANRNYDFKLAGDDRSINILLDIPKTPVPFFFTGLGLGFVPENHSNCNRMYYMIDAGFGTMLSSKYGICKNFKNSMFKIKRGDDSDK
ncbi:hypothetical protein ENBRE01_0383 [Enteropsectra breve]|nr:hypothetical protein ENBRE01_0383 [Enteropsectra breve]